MNQQQEQTAKVSHEIEYRIYGSDFQFMEIRLDPEETLISERGALLYATEGIDVRARLGDGTEATGGAGYKAMHSTTGKLSRALKRKMMGESMWLTHFTNTANEPRILAITSDRPGQIVAIDLSEHGGEIVAEHGAFLAAAAGTQMRMSLKRKIRTSLFGGEGFVLQRIVGDGLVFLHAHGTLHKKRIKDEKLRIDTGCVVAFDGGVTYDARLSGGPTMMAFGGEGAWLATLSGKGTIWLQSQPRPKPVTSKAKSRRR